MTKNCTKCGSDNDGDELWDIGLTEELCQMCWESHCSQTLWQLIGINDWEPMSFLDRIDWGFYSVKGSCRRWLHIINTPLENLDDPDNPYTELGYFWHWLGKW